MNSLSNLGSVTLPHSWQEAATLVSRLPLPSLFIGFTVLPFLSLTTLLLDAAPAAPAMTNTFLAAGIAITVGVVGWLLNRTIAAFDASVKETKEAVLLLSKVVAEIGTEQKASSKLQAYLERRVETLEHKKEVLEKSFAEMDKLIAVRLSEKQNTAR